MKPILPKAIEQKFRDEVAATPYPRERIIDLLRAIQGENGWVSDEGVVLAADILGLSPLQVEEVATFYDKIFRQPVGKRVIHLCDSICCWSRGGEELMAEVQAHLGIAPGETTKDGVFTLLPTCCLGACGKAPAMMIGLQTHGPLTPEGVKELLDRERREVLG